MVRRFFGVAVILLLVLAGAPGCGSSSATPAKKNTVPDPDANTVPKPGGAKAG